MKFEIKCNECEDTFETDRAGLEFWAKGIGKLRHFPAERQITVTVTIKVEQSDFEAEGLI